MRNVIRILALILIWPPDSSTDEAANEAQLTCRRNLKISLQSIFREYENNNTICVSRFFIQINFCLELFVAFFRVLRIWNLLWDQLLNELLSGEKLFG